MMKFFLSIPNERHGEISTRCDEYVKLLDQLSELAIDFSDKLLADVSIISGPVLQLDFEDWTLVENELMQHDTKIKILMGEIYWSNNDCQSMINYINLASKPLGIASIAFKSWLELQVMRGRGLVLLTR